MERRNACGYFIINEISKAQGATFKVNLDIACTMCTLKTRWEGVPAETEAKAKSNAITGAQEVIKRDLCAHNPRSPFQFKAEEKTLEYPPPKKLRIEPDPQGMKLPRGWVELR